MQKLIAIIAFTLAFIFMASASHAIDLISFHSSEWGMSKQQLLNNIPVDFKLVEEGDNLLAFEVADSDGITTNYGYVFNHDNQLVSVMQVFYPEQKLEGLQGILKMHDELVVDIALVYGKPLMNEIIWKVDDAMREQYENNLYQAFKLDYANKVAAWAVEEGRFMVSVTTTVVYDNVIATAIIYGNGDYLKE